MGEREGERESESESGRQRERESNSERQSEGESESERQSERESDSERLSERQSEREVTDIYPIPPRSGVCMRAHAVAFLGIHVYDIRSNTRRPYERFLK